MTTNLRKVTLNFVPRAWAAIEYVSALRGLSRTDAINRAVQFYELAERVTEEGGTLLVRRADGAVEKIVFL